MKFILSSLFIFSVLNAHAYNNVKNFTPIKITPKVIYGEDDRFDIYASSDSLMKRLAKSTAAQILNYNIVQDGDNYTLKARTLAEEMGVCASEPYANQFVGANCSGFLVSPDTLVTAGHCVSDVSECENHVWVFDYANTTEEKSAFTFTKDQVFRCTKIIDRQKNPSNMNDYAVLKLDHPVLNRTPLKYRTSGKVADDAVLTVIGNPSGLPTKITAAADMRDNSNPIYFSTNADTYGGNSGSAVVDARTGIVEGILVRGDQDYVLSEKETCLISARHPMDEGRGEDITRIMSVDALLKN